MDKVTITFVTVTASVILSVAAVTVAAQSGMFAPAPTAGSKTVSVDNSDDIARLEARIEKLSQKVKTPVAENGETVAIDPELANKVGHLETENASLHRKVEELEKLVTELKNRPVESVPSLTPEQAAELDQMAGAQGFATQVERVIEERNRRLEQERRAERRDQAKEAAAERIPRMVEFMANRMELDETQQAMISEAMISFEQQRQDIEYQAWENDWSREETQAQTEALWESTQASLTAAGLSEDQVSGLSRMSRMGGGRGGNMGGFGGRGGQQGGGQGGFGGFGGGRGGRGGGR